MRKVCAITAVSEESPSNFHIANGLILSQHEKNQRISSENASNRFTNRLKRNNLYEKPSFNYSDIRQQAFDYDSITPSKAVDLKNGVSPKLRSLSPFSQGYSKFLGTGFGKRRGQFTLEASQSKVNRMGIKDLQFLSSKKFKIREKSIEKSLKKLNLDSLLTKPNESKSNSKVSRTSLTPINKVHLKQIDEFELNLPKFTAKSTHLIPVKERFIVL